MRHLVKNNPSSRNLDFFDDFFQPLNSWFEDLGQENAGFYPPVNITETEDLFSLEVVAPGMKKEDFKIKTEGDILTISAEQKTEKEEEKKNAIRKEYSYRSFQRSFTLNEDINQEKVEASYKDGVLHLSLPKKEEKIVKPKEIAVR